MKQRNLNTVFANISKATSPTSNSFLLIMSHGWYHTLCQSCTNLNIMFSILYKFQILKYKKRLNFNQFYSPISWWTCRPPPPWWAWGFSWATSADNYSSVDSSLLYSLHYPSCDLWPLAVIIHRYTNSIINTILQRSHQRSNQAEILVCIIPI